MKISCEIYKDLLPLYAEGLASTDSVALVAEHLSSCDNCKEELDKIKSAIPIPSDTNVAPLKKIRSTLRKQRNITVILTSLISLAIAITVFGFLTSPSYLPYSEDIMSVTEQENGTLTVQFGNSVSGYDIDKYIPEEGLYEKDFYCHITAWDSIWNQWFKKSEPQVVVLNPDGSKIARVYYYHASGGENVLVYGEASGGVITHPSRVLFGYIIIAFLLSVVCGLALVLTRKNKKTQIIIRNILFIPVAYIVASFCIVLSRPVSHSIARDFFLIILLAMPIYGFLWFLFNKKKRDK